MKKFIVLLLTIIIVIAFPATALAETTIFDSEEICSSEHEEEYLEVCGGLPYHDLVSNGVASLYYNNNAIIVAGPGWKCTNCYLVMVTDGGSPHYGQAIGNWGICDVGYEVTSVYNIVYATYVGYTTSSKINGYHFRNAPMYSP